VNKLQICQRTARECGVNSINFTTTVGLTGEARRVVDWVDTAYMQLQGMRQDWDWMRASTTFVTVAGQAEYTTAQANTTNFGSWKKESFRGYLTATGQSSEFYLPWCDYEYWRDVYQFGSARTSTSQPVEFTITPAKSIGLGPVPLVGYTIEGDYFTCPVEMSSDSDTPSLPTHYHMAIVWLATMLYGEHEAASETFQKGQRNYDPLIRRMEKDRLPPLRKGRPLA
jgi:hypothetical protein